MKLTPRYTEVLKHLATVNEISSKELAAAIGRSDKRATLAVLLHEMRRRGLTESPEPGIHRITGYGRNCLNSPAEPDQLKIDVAKPDPMPEEVESQPTETVGVPRSQIDALISQISSAIATEIAAQVATNLQRMLLPSAVSAPAKVEEIYAAVSGAISEAANTAPVDAANPIDVPAHSKPVVTIIGLLSGQSQMIQREYGDDLHLKFASSDHLRADRLKAICGNSYATIAAVNFISHSHQDIAKAASSNFITVKGGMSSVRMHLDNIVKQTKPKAA